MVGRRSRRFLPAVPRVGNFRWEWPPGHERMAASRPVGVREDIRCLGAFPMSFDVLAVLFILFSIVSTLVNRFQTKRAEERSAGRGLQEAVEEEDAYDSFDWGRLEEVEPPPLQSRVDVPLAADDPPQQEAGRVPIERTTAAASPESEPADIISSAYDASSRSKRAGRRRALRFDRRAAIRAILYSEILGPPRAMKPIDENWE